MKITSTGNSTESIAHIHWGGAFFTGILLSASLIVWNLIATSSQKAPSFQKGLRCTHVVKTYGVAQRTSPKPRRQSVYIANFTSNPAGTGTTVCQLPTAEISCARHESCYRNSLPPTFFSKDYVKNLPRRGVNTLKTNVERDILARLAYDKAQTLARLSGQASRGLVKVLTIAKDRLVEMAFRKGATAAAATVSMTGMGVAYGVQQAKRSEAATSSASYPPMGLSPGVKQLPQWIQLGCGSSEYVCAEKGATFTAANQPDNLPDLSKHNSYFAETMRANPGLWDKYKHAQTSLGVKFAHCIKTGVDNKGHPMIKTVGAVAGDEESYSLFKDFFDPVISDRHNGYAADAKHPTDLDVRKLSTTKIDPTGKYVLTSRCRTGRSVRGTRLPPCTTFEERREVERVVVKGLLNMTGDLAGDYFPLAGSRSYAAKPGGMTAEKEESLRSRGNLFQEPDSTLLLSSGCGRHWPDARGIFHNNDENLFVWVNEEDQMRIVSMEKGDNVKRIIERFAKATSTIQECLKNEGYDFMHNEHLGWILTCPSNLGTGLRAGAMVKVPHFSSRKDFKAILAKMGLQARGTAGVDSASTGGTWDISNADRLGKSEIELVNIFIEGVAQIIRWEQALEKGENIEAELKAVGLPKSITIEVPFTSTRGMEL